MLWMKNSASNEALFTHAYWYANAGFCVTIHGYRVQLAIPAIHES